MRRPTLCAAAAALAMAAVLPALAADIPAHYPPQDPQTWKPADTYECFAVFARKRDGHGEQLTRYGPEAIGEIGDLRYADGKRLDGRVLSVRTGQSAWLELFDRRGYRRSLYLVGPGQTANLKLANVDSYQLNCEPPVNRTTGW